tara:strand:- start:1347 stop:2681 length:1335 start_codon:yes stop_codon:yes gene_type:complete
MIRVLITIILIIPIYSCSFDNKTGIWQNDQSDKKLSERQKNLKREKIFKKTNLFDKEIKKNLKIKINPEKENTTWKNEYFNSKNNYENFKIKRFEDRNYSKEKHHLKLRGKLLVNDDIIVSYDNKANIIVYSINNREIVLKYDFYKNKFKKIKKKIYLILDIKNNAVIAADNLGYVYSINIKTKKINWAKNFGVPFRSELKIIKNQLFISNQDNILYSIDTNNGKKNWQLLTESTSLKSSFKNSIVADKNNLFFLNSNGKLYSLNHLNKKINWISSFSENISNNKFKFFEGKPITFHKDKLILSSSNQVYLVDSYTGIIIWTKQIQNIVKPIVIDNQIFLLTKNNFLVTLNFNGEVNWSRNIYDMLKKNNFMKVKKVGEITNLALINSNLQATSSEGLIINFNVKNGNIINVYDLLKEKFYFNPIYANLKIYLVNRVGKLLIYH